MSELPLSLRMFLRVYPWRRIKPFPLARRRKLVAESRVALVTTAGLVPAGAAPFNESMAGGDFTFRVIAADTQLDRLKDFQRSESFDHEGMALDRNLVFPLDRLHELARAGEIGEVAPRHLSFMGSITAPGRLASRTAPAAADLLVADAVDLALLLPV